MKALVTGGTSGIGYCMVEDLIKRGYEVSVVSRREGDLPKLIEKYPDAKIHFGSYDLSDENECFRLLKDTENEDFDLFVNNAGFGDIGKITKTDIQKEIKMVKVNDIAALILVKEFLIRFIKKDHGRVLLVCSAAAFGVAPYMNVYYASKAFVYSLVHGYYRELKEMKSKVTISALCPGPVKTRFEEVANAKFSIGSLQPEFVGSYAIKKTLKGKTTIVPGFKMKCLHFFSHLFPRKVISKVMRKQSEMKD
jgi:hypothetical protein